MTPRGIVIFSVLVMIILALCAHQYQIGNLASPLELQSRPIGPIDAVAATQTKPIQSLDEPHPSTQTLHTRFSTLSNTRNPRQAMTAYNMLAECTVATDEEHKAEMEAPGLRSDTTKAALADGSLRRARESACGDLTLEDLSQRMRLVQYAAEAGIPLAAIRLTAEGPWGDPTALITRPDDPAVAQWRDQMRGLTEKAARVGDVAAMQSLYRTYATGTGLVANVDRAAALQWAVARWDVMGQETGSASHQGAKSIASLALGLTPEQAASAVAAGQKIAHSAAAARAVSE